MSSFEVSLSGLRAASTRIAVAADNIANQNSTSREENGRVVREPYVPRQVDQVSLSEGGTQALLRDRNPASVPIFDPDDPDADADGTVRAPNVNLETETVNLIAARSAYKANLNAIKIQADVLNSLLDIQT